MNRTVMVSVAPRPKWARNSSVSRPACISMLNMSTTWSSCWRLRLPLRWLRRSMMSLGISGTASRAYAVDLDDPDLVRKHPLAHLRLAQEVEDRRVRREDAVPVRVAVDPHRRKQIRDRGGREHRLHLDLAALGAEDLEVALEHVGRPDQERRALGLDQRRQRTNGMCLSSRARRSVNSGRPMSRRRLASRAGIAPTPGCSRCWAAGPSRSAAASPGRTCRRRSPAASGPTDPSSSR